jgi:hypothetical protein
MGMDKQMKWEGQWKAWLQRQVYRKCTIIKFKHLMNWSITTAAVYTTLHSFVPKKNKFLTTRRKFQNDLISQLQYQEFELIIVSSHWNLGQSLQHYFSVHIFHNTPKKQKNLKSNSTDILVSQMIMISSYVACEWWTLVVTYWSRKRRPQNAKLTWSHGPNSNFFWPLRNDCCWIEDNNVLLVIDTPSTDRQVKCIKF